MSNYEIFSGIYERLLQYDSQIACGERLRYAAFRLALGSLKNLRDYFATDPSDFSPPRVALNDAARKLIMTFGIPALDNEIQTSVKPEIERIKKAQEAKLRGEIEQKFLQYYSPEFEGDPNANLNDYLRGLQGSGYPRQFIYVVLEQIRKKYFMQDSTLSSSSTLFAQVMQNYKPIRFEAGHYEFKLDPSVTLLYQIHRMTHQLPFSARDVRDLERECPNDETHSRSLPNFSCFKIL